MATTQALREEIAMCRPVLAALLRDSWSARAAAESHCARSLAAELAHDNAQASFHYAMAKRLYAQAREYSGQRSALLGVVRRMEREVLP